MTFANIFDQILYLHCLRRPAAAHTDLFILILRRGQRKTFIISSGTVCVVPKITTDHTRMAIIEKSFFQYYK